MKPGGKYDNPISGVDRDRQIFRAGWFATSVFRSNPRWASPRLSCRMRAIPERVRKRRATGGKVGYTGRNEGRYSHSLLRTT